LVLIYQLKEADNNSTIFWKNSVSLPQDIKYYDEVLTMSMGMAILRHDKTWLDRYDSAVAPLDNAIKASLKAFPELEPEVNKVCIANDILLGYEDKAIFFVKIDKYKEAEKIIFIKEYADAKATYTNALDKLVHGLQIKSTKHIDDTRDRFTFLLVTIVSLLILMTILGFYMFRIFSKQNEYLEKTVQEKTKDIIASKKVIEEIHKHTRESIEYASLIQHTLIPSNDVFRGYFSDYLTIWHPKDIVGGDVYLFEELRGNKNECLLMVIDCTGHGVPGAFVTMLVKAIERQVIAKINNDSTIDVSAAWILAYFNRTMKKLLRQEDETSISNAGFDGAILYYNKRDKIIKFAGAETTLFYVENNELKTIKGDRHSVGYKKSDMNYNFKEYVINAKDGMKFYISTDGYLDQNGGEKGFPFGKKRFSEIISEFHHESFADQQEIFLDSLHEYQKNQDRNDDVTVIGIKI